MVRSARQPIDAVRSRGPLRHRLGRLQQRKTAPPISDPGAECSPSRRLRQVYDDHLVPQFQLLAAKVDEAGFTDEP